jgi:multicomponent K+:H+ antiporter subunit G
MSQAGVFADAAGALLLVAGALFALVGSWGLVKLGSFLTRLHGPTKATTMGVGCVLLASMIHFALRGTPALHELLVTMGLFLTAPVSAHVMVKAALHLDPSARPPAPRQGGESSDRD